MQKKLVIQHKDKKYSLDIYDKNLLNRPSLIESVFIAK
ncbi:hypothetical protein OTSSIDO_0895, partial [Orientia tsutsugamushi str. Sido]